MSGADLSKREKMRSKISDVLQNKHGHTEFYIFYPENMFNALLNNEQTKGLFSVERLLEESVDAIVVILESPDSFAEMAAILHEPKLRQKLICVVDKKYRKDKAFLSQHSLEMAREANDQGIFFIDTNNVQKGMPKIVASLKKMKKRGVSRNGQISPLQLDLFLIAAVFLMEPVSEDQLIPMVAEALDDEKNAILLTGVAMSVLINNRAIVRSAEGYQLTPVGTRVFSSSISMPSRKGDRDREIALDEIRLEILNKSSAPNKIKMWEGILEKAANP